MYMETIKRNIKKIFNEKVNDYVDYLGYSPYKNQITLEKRLEQSNKIMEKYPNRLPIICDVSKKLPPLDKHKYLIPYDLKSESFMYIIRRRIELNQEQAMYFFVGDKLLHTNKFMSEIYDNYKDEDGFLYVYACAETTFG